MFTAFVLPLCLERCCIVSFTVCAVALCDRWFTVFLQFSLAGAGPEPHLVTMCLLRGHRFFIVVLLRVQLVTVCLPC
jgi:hypothetical protein